jgi:diaminopimelate epimerase
MMRIGFTKMHGASNDYIYLDGTRGLPVPAAGLPGLARAISERHTGVGSDGLIVALPAPSPDADFGFRMFNSDGSEGEMCGNGMRCFARFVVEGGLTSKRTLTVATLAGLIKSTIIASPEIGPWTVTSDLGAPRLAAAEVPTRLPAGRDGTVINCPLTVAGYDLQLTAVSTGVPHTIIFVDEPDAMPWRDLGRAIEVHEAFPRHTNVEFVRVDSPEHATVRVWERGSGETLACGTGACAVVVAGALTGRLQRKAVVSLPGGDLTVEWGIADGRVLLTGPAARVCDGEFIFVE